MASKCRKFEPNIFNKLKCQACFGAKDAHSAEALHNNKASRKVSKCGFLFVAPDFDFSNPLEKTKRWQRRFMRLFDDGELTYCVDEDPETIPQGIIDMNKCSAVNDAESVTSHPFSLEIVTPNKKYYIKGQSKEEYQWWHDVLQVFPGRLTKTKNRRFTMPIFSNKENVQPTSARLPSASSITEPETVINGRFNVEKVKSKEQQFSTYRGVRNMKHKTDKHYQEGLRKSSSLHDLSSAEMEKDAPRDLAETRYLSRSGDRLDSVSGSNEAYKSNVARVLSDSNYINNPYFTIPRRTWQTLAANYHPASSSVSHASVSTAASSNSSPPQHSQVTGIPALRRGSLDDKTIPVSNKPKNASERARLHRERSTSLKDFSTQLSLAKQEGSGRTSLSGLDRMSSRSDAQSVGRQGGQPEYESRNNETDEHKMAKSSELQAASRTQSSPVISGTPSQSSRYEDLMYMKKGWLIKQGSSEKDWKKHWFVLTGNSLRYYKDAKAEETNTLDGKIDLSGCYDISEVNVGRNYGFRIKGIGPSTSNGEYVLSAMTSGIRNNWMKAIRLVMDLQQSGGSKNSSGESEHSSGEDLEINLSSSGRLSLSPDSRSSTESPGPIKKEPTIKNVRRHYSDVNPGNVGKMLSVKDALPNLNLESITLPPSFTVGSLSSSRESSVEKEEGRVKPMIVTESPSPDSDSLSLSANSLPLRRFVEGSDISAESAVPTSESRSLGISSESKKEETEKQRRAKSPSVRVKDRSRVRSPRLHSPQDTDEELHPETTSDRVDGLNSSSGSLHDNRSGGAEEASGGALVDLLETEVDSLKDRLDEKHKELVKMQESNQDLKSRLQTVVREKDISQPQHDQGNQNIADQQAEPSKTDNTEVTTMRRQVKEARDTVQKQKAEIDNLRTKLNMSVSKLTGTEKALSEALKDLKQEKEKFMKMSTDWNKKIRNLEVQLKDSSVKVESQQEMIKLKDSEIKRLQADLKTNLQKIREQEREILKLKTLELEYKQLKGKMDEANRKVTELKSDLKDRDQNMKKLEREYEQQINDMEHEFSKERDDMEQHMEEMKKQFLEAQRQLDIPENIAQLLAEKDEIIAQLEEKMIENDKKFGEMSEEFQAEIADNEEFQSRLDEVQKSKDLVEKKLQEVERCQRKVNLEKERLENDNKTLTKSLEDLKKENSELNSKLASEKQTMSTLEKEKSSIESKIQKGSSDSDEGKTQRLIEYIMAADSEMKEVVEVVLQSKRGLEEYIGGKKGESQLSIQELAKLVANVEKRCKDVQDILNESLSFASNGSTKDSDPSEIQHKYEQVLSEVTKLTSELEDAYAHCEETEMKEKEMEGKLHIMTTQYQQQIDTLNARIDQLSNKSGVPVKASSITRSGGRKTPVELSDEIEKQLNELEERIDYVDVVLKTRSSVDSASVNGDLQSTSEEEDSDSFLSSDEKDSEDEVDARETSGASSADNQLILSKLKEMKIQLETTNIRIKDITGDLTDHNMSSANESTGDMDEDLRKTLQKCGEKIDSLTLRLTEKVRMVNSGTEIFDPSSDNTLAFKQCLKHLKEKLQDINNNIAARESLDAKGLKIVHTKLLHLSQYIGELQKFERSDFNVISKMSRHEARAAAMMGEREKMSKRGRMSLEDKMNVYADRLSVEAIILGQMAYMIQRHQMGCLSRDVLMKEIQGVNSIILEMERRIDNSTRDLSNSDQERSPDLVSSYAEMLAEKIVLEGQLASSVMAEDHQNTDDIAILSSLNITDNPSILAMEVFLRSQVDSSVHQQLTKSVREMEELSGHIISRSLIQGEISYALQKLKQRFNTHVESEELSDLLQRERKFLCEQLQDRSQSLYTSVADYQTLVLSCINCHINLSSGHIRDSLSTTLVAKFHKHISSMREQLGKVDSNEQERIKNVIVTLEEDCKMAKSELEKCDGSVNSDSSELNLVPPETLLVEWTDILILRSVVRGTIAHVNALYSSGHIPNSESFGRNHESDMNELSTHLGNMLEKEAVSKQTLAAELKTAGNSSKIERVLALVDIIPDFCAFDPDNLNEYAKNLVREAMYQAQVTYTNYKTRLQHEKEMRDLKIKMEAGQKVDLPSESSRETENDIRQSLSVFEEILETKFEDECEVLSILDKQMKQFQNVAAGLLTGAEAKQFEQELNSFAASLEHELSVAQERHDIHLDVLRQEISTICLRLEKITEEHDQEKITLSTEYEERIQTLQDELDCIKIDHEDELEQVRQDILTAVSAIKANEEQSEEQLADQVKILNRQLTSQKENFVAALEQLQKSLTVTGANEALSQKLEEQIEHLQSSGTLHPDQLHICPVSPIPTSPPPIRDIDEPQEENNTEECSEAKCVANALDKSSHDYELELLKKEKEEALAEEVKTTKAALDAMRKAYEEDLEEEKEKYRVALKTMFTDDFVDEIRSRHENEATKLREELAQVTMHYDSRCEDYKLLEDKLESTKREYDSHINQLIKSNEQLNSLVNEEINKLKDFIQNRTMASVPGNATIEEELYDAQIMVRVKDAELQKLRSQVKNLENNLERTTEEQRQSMTQYLQMYKKYTELQNKIKQDISAKEKEDSKDRNRQLRRNNLSLKARHGKAPSFHHRARSPSPTQQNASKKDEHQSRDSHKRRCHLDVKDLKRSKSSPSLPFVFDGRLPMGQGKHRDSTGGSKYSKAKTKASNV
ncbi:uncharacterized protein LOC134276428 isoform X3 [Saccostrea cucullata]|uniref:uncharacterized protein LOC134276428 isoform X3 n=1 Tax=Saccostrea cuccullata TaxID=36930 RepID=UPI002ED320CF